MFFNFRGVIIDFDLVHKLSLGSAPNGLCDASSSSVRTQKARLVCVNSSSQDSFSQSLCISLVLSITVPSRYPTSDLP